MFLITFVSSYFHSLGYDSSAWWADTVVAYFRPYHMCIVVTRSLVGCGFLSEFLNVHMTIHLVSRCLPFMYVQRSWLHLSDFMMFI